MNILRRLLLLAVLLLTACATPWGGDMGCLTLASYPERVDCQARNHRNISGDEEIRRQALRLPAVTDKTVNTADSLCYVKAGEGEKPCAK